MVERVGCAGEAAKAHPVQTPVQTPAERRTTWSVLSAYECASCERPKENGARSNSGQEPVTRSATTSPIAGANLNPCPEHALTTTIRSSLGSRSTRKSWSGVFVYIQITPSTRGPFASGIALDSHCRRGRSSLVLKSRSTLSGVVVTPW